MEYIDLTPSWETAAHVYITALEHGTGSGKKAARDEIVRLGRLCDHLIKQLKPAA